MFFIAILTWTANITYMGFFNLNIFGGRSTTETMVFGIGLSAWWLVVYGIQVSSEKEKGEEEEEE